MSIAERVQERWLAHGLYAQETSAASGTVEVANWGWFPALSLVNAVSLLLFAVANRIGYGASAWAGPLFWVALAGLLIPNALRLIAVDTTRRERMALVLGLGMTLYLFKVVHSPFAFTYSDEFAHLFNASRILKYHGLFTENSGLPASAYFPGLASVTAALATFTGLSIFHAGLIVIGGARLVLLLGLYLLMEQVSRSARVAALATAIYMCHSSFLFWSSQFAYESLALPLMVGVFFVIARRSGLQSEPEQATAQDRRQYIGLSLMALLGVVTVTITHHLTSYFMVTFLAAWYVAVRLQLPKRVMKLSERFSFRKNRKDSNGKPTLQWIAVEEVMPSPQEVEVPERGPEGIAVFAIIAVLSWLAFMAILTIDYLSTILSRGVLSIINLVMGEGAGRQLFVSQSGYTPPIWETVFALGSVVISLAALMWGIQHLWRRSRFNALALVFSLCGLSYFAFLGLRLTSASWELSNRASAYLFIGLAYVLALAVAELWNGRRWIQFPGKLLFACVLFVLFSGGVIAGWQPQNRLTQPYVVTAGDQVVHAEGYAMANWLRTEVGPGRRVVADIANGLQILAYGEQRPTVGRNSFVRILLNDVPLMHWHLDVMDRWDVQYMVVDRRLSAWDNMRGYFFDRKGGIDPETDWMAPEAIAKYDQLNSVDRVMDSGNIVVYNVGAIRYE